MPRSGGGRGRGGAGQRGRSVARGRGPTGRSAAGRGPASVSGRHKEIAATGRKLGFRVTSTTGGRHNRGSLHAKGRAVDFSVRGKTPAQVRSFMKAMRGKGYKVRDERTRPPGQRVWGGPHIHVSK